MASSSTSDSLRRSRIRYTDISEEPSTLLLPFPKFNPRSQITLKEAVENLHRVITDLDEKVQLSLDKCSKPKDGLTIDESAAIYLYSLQWPSNEQSFYTHFNRALRNKDRTKLIPFQKYLYLFTKALEKLSPINDRIWRAVNSDLSEKYLAQSVHVWWGATSCSDMVHVTDGFLDKNKSRTLFNIKCTAGKAVKNHSAFPEENEIVLAPASCFRVKSISNPAPKLHIVDMEQIPYDESLLTSDRTIDSSTYIVWLDTSVSTSNVNIDVQRRLQNLTTKFEIFDEPRACENFMRESSIRKRIILIVGGKVGRRFIPDIHSYSNCVSIFVFCLNKEENEKWASNYDKVKAVIIQEKELINQVEQELKYQIEQERRDNESFSTNDDINDYKIPWKIQELISPQEGYQHMPLVSLERALQPLSGYVPDAHQFGVRAKELVGKSPHGLSIDEAAAIMIYTMEWPDNYTNLSERLNDSLSQRTRLGPRPWFLYLKLILTGLYRLPSFEGTVWRSGEDYEYDRYERGKRYTWWTFSKTSSHMELLESRQLSNEYSHGSRTIFSIQCKNGKSIKHYSNFPDEDEILLMPGFHFEVISQAKLGENLRMVNLREVQTPYPLIPPPF